MTISVNKTTIMAFKGKWLVHSKIMIDSHVLKQVNNFQYFGCDFSFGYDYDVGKNLQNFRLYVFQVL